MGLDFITTQSVIDTRVAPLRAHLYKKEKTHLSYQHFSVMHLSARASLLIPPSAFVRVAALAFTNTKAHSKAAGDHLYLTCLCHAAPGVLYHMVSPPLLLSFHVAIVPSTTTPLLLIANPINAKGILKGLLGRPIPQFQLWSGSAITTCQSDTV